MAEPTLALKRSDLKAATGLFLGYGRGSDEGDAAWSTRQSAILDMLVSDGLRQFYYPPADQSGVSYEWSFLRPTAELSLASGETGLLLPDDFGGVSGEIQIEASNNEIGLPLQVTSMPYIRQLRMEFPSTTGRPLWCAVEPQRITSGAKGQRWRMEIYPEADQAYTLQVAYFLHPGALDGTRDYAYGGPAHAATIEASIAAMAEVKLDDVIDGPRRRLFMERLAASISQDRKLKPQVLGYNGDRSNLTHAGVNNPRETRFRGNVTVGGTLY